MKMKKTWRKLSMSNLNKAREQLVNIYIESLEKDVIPWRRPWDAISESPINAISKTLYHGVNHCLLTIVSDLKGYSDHRWCTFKQARDNKWNVKQGSKGVPIEYWSIYNLKEKRVYKPEDYNRYIREHPDKAGDFTWLSKCYYVFNGDCIEGMPEKTEIIKHDPIEPNFYISSIIKGLRVRYEEKGTSAYYSPVEDKVVLPPSFSFADPYEYNATQLHELCHATGHPSRLNRGLKGQSSSTSYALEELRAEISSSFLMQKLDIKYAETYADNHVAYVQSWIEVLGKTPDELFKAIKDADKIVAYIDELSKDIVKDFESVNAPTSTIDQEQNHDEFAMER